MSLFAIIIAIIAVILLVTGGFVQSLNFLLWVGIVLLVIAVIAFLLRSISGRRQRIPGYPDSSLAVADRVLPVAVHPVGRVSVAVIWRR